MIELDLLCKLEKHYNSLDMYEMELKNILQKISINEIEKKLLDKERQIEILEKRKEKIKADLRKSEQKLKGYNYKIKEIESKLYSGETKDINQLEKWSIEKESIDNIINDSETKVLEFMEEIEKIAEDLNFLKKSLTKIKEEYKNYSMEYEKIENTLNEKIEFENKNICKLEKTIEENLLKKYKLIRKNKKTAVAQVQNNICSGCNISISTYILEKMKRDEEIVHCELCGRILCKL